MIIQFTTVCIIYSSEACAIPNSDTVIITGGRSTLSTVSVYNVGGWQEELLPLNTGRERHACSSFWSDERRVQELDQMRGDINVYIYC